MAAVTDDEIVAAIRLLAQTEGILTEPAGGVTVATLAKLAREGVITADERVVAYVTGHGLKAPEAIPPGDLTPIAATVGAFQNTYQSKE